MSARPPAVAGLFYPDRPEELRSMIASCFEESVVQTTPLVPKALIVPHAGYIYSGPIAASAYARLAPLRDRVKRIVLFGPAHRVAFHGIAASSADAFETPLGRVEIDRTLVSQALALPGVRVLDRAHADEHSLEVQLPFLQTVLGDFRLVPLLVGEATPDEVADVVEALWDGEETLLLVSSDLSHYLSYEAARRIDQETTASIERLAPEEIGYDQACGRLPVQGLLLAARRHGLRATTLDLRNSGDTAGPRDSVVGYGAYALA
ncbi:MAG TPA: AmmeMemoRadiSam system protein B [Deltaproteobacteria bacterium]|jgi:AmmeMemoRadiSam system protein B|nr:AmmeMemoRadiSam system protein B [Deltaproteobacteria bacterium]